MTNIADTMLQLLPFSLTDSRWSKLLREHEHEITQPFERRPGKGTLVIYDFQKLGVKLYTDGNGWVLTILFQIGPTYTCDLPFGLKHTFLIGDVHQLHGPPHGVHEPRGYESEKFGSESYVFNTEQIEYRLSVWYSIEDGLLDHLKVMGVVHPVRSTVISQD